MNERMNWLCIILFLLRYSLVAVSLGILFINIKVFQRLKLWGRFTLGMSMTTVILPFVTFMGALLWVGIPRIVLFWVPVLLSFWYLFYKNNYKTIGLLAQEFKNAFFNKNFRDNHTSVGNIAFKFIVVICSLMFIILGMQIFNIRLHKNLYGSDEAHYIIQAKIFHENRNSWGIDRYKEEYEGTVFADDHGPLWPVYLADSVLLKRNFDINATEINLAYILTIIAMAAIIIDVGYIITNNLWGGFFALYLYFLYHYSFYFPLNGSRDGFRMVALFGFFVLLFELSIKIWKGKNISWKEGIELLFFSYWSLNGHAGNIFIMLGISVTFFILELFFKLPLKQVLFSGISILVGTLLCFIKNISHYIENGRFITSTIGAFRETEAAKIVMEYQKEKYGWKLVANTFEKSDILLVIIGCMAIIFYLIKAFSYFRNAKEGREYGEKICASYLLIGLLLPMTGIFNFVGYNVPLYFLGQPRYKMYFLVVMALLGGMMFSEIYHCRYKFSFIITIRIVFIIVLFIGLFNLCNNYPRVISDAEKSDIDFIKEMAEIAENQADGGNIFVGEQIAAAYFNKPPKILFDYYAKPILTANNNTEIEQALNELNIQIFVINWLCDYYHYDVLPFYHYLQTSKNIKREYYEKNGRYTEIYIVDEAIWR